MIIRNPWTKQKRSAYACEFRFKGHRRRRISIECDRGPSSVTRSTKENRADVTSDRALLVGFRRDVRHDKHYGRQRKRFRTKTQTSRPCTLLVRLNVLSYLAKRVIYTYAGTARTRVTNVCNEIPVYLGRSG